MPKIKDLSDNLDAFKECLLNRNVEKLVPMLEKGIELKQKLNDNRVEYDTIRSKVKKLSEEFRKTKDESLMDESRQLGTRESELQEQAAAMSEELDQIETMMPNWYTEDTPVGKGDEFEKPIRYGMKPKVFKDHKEDFDNLYPECEYELSDEEPFHHYQLVGTLVDQEKGGEIAESRFYFELDDLVILDLALNMYSIEFFKSKGFADRLMIPPFMMRQSVERKTTYYEAFEDTIFEVNDGNLILIPSSEHSIINFYQGEMFKEDALPIRITAWSPCFRREAGAHGKDTRGIFRVKQFVKVELHSIVKAENDLAEIDTYTDAIEDFMHSLDIPTRTVIVPTGDMDKRASKQIDIQAWLPGQGRFRETHSIASISTWASEKLGIKYKTDKKKKELVRNVYATGVAIQRMLCVIAENHYDKETNSIVIPEVLRKYAMGVERIQM